MIAVQSILRAGVAVQAAGLALNNLGLDTKKPSTKSIVKKGVTNLIGIPLLQTQSQLIGGL